MRGKRSERRSVTVQYGVVKWFDPLKGYGFIAGDDCKDVFVHQSNILMNGFRTLETGQRVRYQVDQTNKGNIAVNVVVE
ncbi:MAG: cold shock domain-containing protein [Mediterraneibacter gnavus]|uniref:cold shock domain-containing protein n=1 Tax=Mediterraneibacter gnavus TaxID=33038 RepID=UPI003568A291